MKIKDYSKVGGTANTSRGKKYFKLHQEFRKRSKKIRLKLEKFKVLHL